MSKQYKTRKERQRAEDRKMKIKICFITAFFICLTIAFYVAHFTQIPHGYYNTQGVCVGVSTHTVGSGDDRTDEYIGEYEYTVRGHKYTVSGPSVTFKPRVGKSKKVVWYDSDSPSSAKIVNYNNLISAIVLTAILLFLGGLTVYTEHIEPYIKSKKKSKKRISANKK